jgi:hypothetical protein
MLFCQLRTGYGGKLTKIKSFELRQTTQLARDESCQPIHIYKTVEEIKCKIDPNNIIVSNSELDTVANLHR